MFLFLIASGLSLVFGVLRVLNFAHGSFYMLGAYIAWQMVTVARAGRGGFWPAALGAALGIALLGFIIERLMFRHLYEQEELYQLLFTYALVLILGDAAKLSLGHAAAFGITAAGAGWQPPVSGTLLPEYNLFIMVLGTRHRGRLLARPDPHQRRADDPRCRDRSRDAGRARRQCRLALYRRVRRQLVSLPACRARW